MLHRIAKYDNTLFSWKGFVITREGIRLKVDTAIRRKVCLDFYHHVAGVIDVDLIIKLYLSLRDCKSVCSVKKSFLKVRKVNFPLTKRKFYSPVPKWLIVLNSFNLESLSVSVTSGQSFGLSNQPETQWQSSPNMSSTQPAQVINYIELTSSNGFIISFLIS